MFGSEWFDSHPGGLNRYFGDLTQALASRPDTLIHAYAFGTPRSAPGVSLGSMTASLPRRLRSARRARAGTPAVVDTHFPLYQPRVSSSDLRPVRVAHFHGPWSAESAMAGSRPLSVFMKYQIEKRYYASRDHVICLSQPFADWVVQNCGVRADRVSVIPPGVSVPTRIETLERERYVVCVRRLEARMGIHVLIRAWASLSREFPDHRLLIVGEGSERSRLGELAANSGAAETITFAGRLSEDDLSAAYARATISVMPSIGLEGFGLSALESLAHGTPVVVTDCGGLPGAVRGLDESLIVPPANHEALAARITAALRGNRPSEAACIRHASGFSWDAVADAHHSLYSQLLERRAATAR